MSIKLKDQNIGNIYIGSTPIKGVYLGTTTDFIPIWENGITGTLDNGKVKYVLKKGILTFTGTGTIPEIDDTLIPTTKRLVDNYSKITKIIINETITGIRQNAFNFLVKNGSQLQSIELPFIGNKYNQTTKYPFGYIFNYEEKPSGWDDSDSENTYALPQSSTYDQYNNTENSASKIIHCYCTLPISLKEVIIKESNQKLTIYSNAFYNCAQLETIKFSNNIQEIKRGCLSGCDNLIDLTIPFIGNKGYTLGKPNSITYDGPIIGGYDVNFGTLFNNKNVRTNSALYYDCNQCSGYWYDNPYYLPRTSGWSWYKLPQSLECITITGYDVLSEVLRGLIGNGNRTNDNIMKINFTSTNKNNPTTSIGAYNFEEGSCYLYLPNTLKKDAIGYIYSKKPEETKEVRYQGYDTAWNALKDSYNAYYIKQITHYEFFEKWTQIINPNIGPYTPDQENSQEATTS